MPLHIGQDCTQNNIPFTYITTAWSPPHLELHAMYLPNANVFAFHKLSKSHTVRHIHLLHSDVSSPQIQARQLVIHWLWPTSHSCPWRKKGRGRLRGKEEVTSKEHFWQCSVSIFFYSFATLAQNIQNVWPFKLQRTRTFHPTKIKAHTVYICRAALGTGAYALCALLETVYQLLSVYHPQSLGYVLQWNQLTWWCRQSDCGQIRSRINQQLTDFNFVHT